MKAEKKYLQLLLSVSVMLLSSFSVMSAAPDGHGTVNLSGEIIDSACSIGTDSLDQTIDMGMVPVSLLRQSGRAPPKSFNIELYDCTVVHQSSRDLLSPRSFQMIFEGPQNGDYFTVEGEARGVQLALFNSQGTLIKPGEPMAEDKMFSTPNRSAVLNYELQLVADNKPFKIGTYHTLIGFKLEYY
ncbi:fimbrial protein [uncultured Cedecea sp.]|uniref:fimbrial protein n=1 Tax=uncultured Cedecea sp. TaxID=988762 RepID=UPI00260793EF|nr:fimbrial protein [uncultured Cedecea sp.]